MLCEFANCIIKSVKAIKIVNTDLNYQPTLRSIEMDETYTWGRKKTKNSLMEEKIEMDYYRRAHRSELDSKHKFTAINTLAVLVVTCPCSNSKTR